ncbi:CPBP family intramembrane glutamic endopeptidase [Enterococcus columbae]|uniref:CAAX prenyl protease 2/Lysostaphin resistance protein A-like domain-containing protein n=1 Tax=Enterococcus columbae DSM 7374 = ATCC 51263 TaxID=1121865 RepID=S1N3X6_9ENTE|nr:CPBP family intramembrane glutamic endopeptidase [Enterococcus columbae]EOT40522.1 hypothetical protein OMW_01384 [Enterococcus columbae DSM 7374 = ATCC 51263]EOW80298.1 hypothetical protein I568_01998 [Enterococcus columbae DSM 7374 = ATCC 51263]OJG25544.1 hypothetical protein RR47_GL001593 [Enterococcus columbae DSM 7374 = ATCC 51263]
MIEKIKKQKRGAVLAYYLLFMIICPVLLERMWIKMTMGNHVLAQHLSLAYFYLSHFILFIGGICWLYRKDYAHYLKNWRQQLLKNIGFSLLGFFLMVLFANLLVLFIPQQSSNQAILTQLGQHISGIQLVLFIVVTVILGPINEELVFRTVLIGQTKTRYQSVLLVFVSSLLFGAVHVHTLSEWPVGLVYASSGLALSLTYVWSKNSLTNTTAHLLNNSLAILSILK